MGLPADKPVSVPLRAIVIHLDRPLLNGSSNLPGSETGRAAPPPLFGLAPRGVFLAAAITCSAVRSYRTISPLPSLAGRRFFFCCTFREDSLKSPPRPLAGAPPCGDRTFLPHPSYERHGRRSVRQAHLDGTPRLLICGITMHEITPELLAAGLLRYVVFLFSTTCHEAAHALAAKWGGDLTAFHGRPRQDLRPALLVSPEHPVSGQPLFVIG